ncbi:MAG: metalloprotease TldD, partial [Proteobacteria bacterium]|nr:metalloprotease TldD [Pseudomonadota bacterium]
MTSKTKPFTPFETAFDENVALKVLREAVHGADDGELFLERRRSEALVYDDGKLKTAS